METIMDKVIGPAMAVAINLQLAESGFLDYQMQQGADALSSGRLKLEPAYQQHHARVWFLRRQFETLLRVSSTPLCKLTCWHCGAPTMGRPWHGLPTGKGLCVGCIETERQQMSGEPLFTLFGIEGVHCGYCEQAGDSTALTANASDCACAGLLPRAARSGLRSGSGDGGDDGDVRRASLSTT